MLDKTYSRRELFVALASITGGVGLAPVFADRPPDTCNEKFGKGNWTVANGTEDREVFRGEEWICVRKLERDDGE